MARLLSAAALSESRHCSACGATSPAMHDGTTVCCNVADCTGQGAHFRAKGCCAAMADRKTEATEATEVEAPARPAARPAARTTRTALGASSADGWELLYDKPKAGAEVGRRYVGEKVEYALICKAHGHVRPLARLSDEGAVRKAGGWCPSC